ncbi:beta-amyrin 16-alpha-hydroxylase CYP87D16-like isoform X2 [Humulus lupulus]|uniref:beta-amyrin 16-alpha-hydroxylase CYP87D16-like isoform X2 n=1 Tax=Humulus lupulus TaxID=3486 RepID=UPI002B40A166|nr:beta-amyrin 16-alpha-hydroxylase CYP87D16-like isoform X2 [Humulus lupulus]
MWTNTVVVGLVGLLVIWLGNWIRRWRNPKCNGILPPGSMGFPLIGETLSLIIPSYSLDLHPFFKTRIQRYGTIFRTNIAARPAIISVDPEFNNFLLREEGRLVELWYLDTFSKIFTLEGESQVNAVGAVHKYLRRTVLNHFGIVSLREKLLPQLEQVVNKALSSWSAQDSVEIKQVASSLSLEFGAKQIFSYDAESSPTSITEALSRILNGLLSFPLNIPGTAYHQSLKAEQEAILKNRQNPNSSLTWDEYKSMTFTHNVINESLRMGNTAPGLLRRAIKDIPVKEFTIPAGWTIMMVTSAQHFSPNTFHNPLEFNPRRWKELDSTVTSNNFTPFGGGGRQCAGAEYSRVFMATFFHVLLTKYRWTKIRGNIFRNPILGFGKGVYIKFYKK